MVEGRAAVLNRPNIDTDQIFPARFLRKPQSAGYNNFLFHDSRLADPDFPLKAEGNPPILIAGWNFGCGSSREAAVHALAGSGVRCIMATGFGDIFCVNAAKNGLLTMTLPQDQHAAILQQSDGLLSVDPRQQTIRFGNHVQSFALDPFLKQCLQDGLDEIGLTLAHNLVIEAFEISDVKRRPWAVPD